MLKIFRLIGSCIFGILGIAAISLVGLLLTELFASDIAKMLVMVFFGTCGLFVSRSIFVEYRKLGFISFISRISATPELDNPELLDAEIGL